MNDEKRKGLPGKITAITSVLVALTALIAAVGLFYDETENLVCRIVPSWCAEEEHEECSQDLMTWEEYRRCRMDRGLEP